MDRTHFNIYFQYFLVLVFTKCGMCFDIKVKQIVLYCTDYILRYL